MNQFSGKSVSYWNQSPAIPRHRALRTNPSVDVCIVGAGIAGLTSAYLLQRAGKSVMVLEQGQLVGGDTGRTTAHLSSIIDDGLSNIEKWHGLDGAKKAYASHREAIAQIEKIVTEEKIECDFLRVDGYLFGNGTSEEGAINEELKAARRAGIKVTALKKALIKGFRSGSCLRFPEQAQFHVTKYLKGLAHIIVERGGKIYDRTHVSEIKQGAPAQVKTKSGRNIKADFVIEAANSLISGRVSTITKLFPYRTFAIAAEVPHGSIAPRFFGIPKILTITYERKPSTMTTNTISSLLAVKTIKRGKEMMPKFATEISRLGPGRVGRKCGTSGIDGPVKFWKRPMD